MSTVPISTIGFSKAGRTIRATTSLGLLVCTKPLTLSAAGRCLDRCTRCAQGCQLNVLWDGDAGQETCRTRWHLLLLSQCVRVQDFRSGFSRLDNNNVDWPLIGRYCGTRESSGLALRQGPVMGVCQSVYVPRRPVYNNLGCVVCVLRAQPRSSQMNLIHALLVVACSMHGYRG